MSVAYAAIDKCWVAENQILPLKSDLRGKKERDSRKILDSGGITLYSKMLKSYLVSLGSVFSCWITVVKLIN